MTTPETTADLLQRYAASKPGLGRSQLAERIVDEVLPKVREALEAAADDFDNEAWNMGADKFRDAIALLDGKVGG